MKVLEIRNLHRAYQPGEDVLCGIDFSIKKGEVVGLLGQNGAGKTTLIRVTMGMLGPCQGSVRLFDLDPREEPVAVKLRIGYVSEDQILPDFLKVEQIIGFHRNLFPSWDDDLARELGRRFSLPLTKKIKSLSKGQARQVALLCAVSHRPELLILDEPAGGLDPAARREFLETSIRLLNDSGSTILFSSHHMTDVERMAGRVVMIHEGRLLLDQDLDQLREDHCLALIPKTGVNQIDLIKELQSIRGCLGVRDRSDALHAIFAHNPQQCQSALTTSLGIDGIRCVSIALEEMFIELAGGQS